MFQSVVHQSGVSTGRVGTAVWVSLFLHAGALGALLGATHGKEPVVQKEHELVFVPPRPPRGNPNPPAPQVAQPVAPKPKPKPKTALVQPREVKPLPKEVPPPVEPTPEPIAAPEVPADPSLPYIPGSHPDGVETGGIVGAPLPDAMLQGLGAGGTGEDVIPFGAGMTPPRLVSTGTPLEYTLDAMRARVQGMVVARCTITREGTVTDCRMIKGQPFMEEAVMASLTSRRYQPLTYQGRQVNVSYTFNVNLRLP